MKHVIHRILHLLVPTTQLGRPKKAGRFELEQECQACRQMHTYPPTTSRTATGPSSSGTKTSLSMPEALLLWTQLSSAWPAVRSQGFWHLASPARRLRLWLRPCAHRCYFLPRRADCPLRVACQRRSLPPLAHAFARSPLLLCRLGQGGVGE